jgi:hypothetical protein
MHASESPFEEIVAHIRLNRMEINALVSKLTMTPGTKEPSAVIIADVRDDAPNSLNIRLQKLHIELRTV